MMTDSLSVINIKMVWKEKRWLPMITYTSDLYAIAYLSVVCWNRTRDTLMLSYKRMSITHSPNISNLEKLFKLCHWGHYELYVVSLSGAKRHYETLYQIPNGLIKGIFSKWQWLILQEVTKEAALPISFTRYYILATLNMGHGGGTGVSIPAFFFDSPSANPAAY